MAMADMTVPHFSRNQETTKNVVLRAYSQNCKDLVKFCDQQDRHLIIEKPRCNTKRARSQALATDTDRQNPDGGKQRIAASNG